MSTWKAWPIAGQWYLVDSTLQVIAGPFRRRRDVERYQRDILNHEGFY